ncbi:hypothetical protein HPB47_018164 [Ixodes persulcatus]|uniref:Uncharacterized protein n=1 Tax=Ixodes persulcatus TaxID=34615 RepID=A0AC60QLH2_IXOPE|nr:hypothetical protein HPB47_018164 [Ixodes persulcatus]
MRQVQLPAAASCSEVPALDVSNEKDDSFGPGASRFDSHFYTASETAQRAARADEMKEDLAAKPRSLPRNGTLLPLLECQKLQNTFASCRAQQWALLRTLAAKRGRRHEQRPLMAAVVFVLSAATSKARFFKSVTLLPSKNASSQIW